MAVAVTLKQLYEEVLRRTGLGFPLALITGTTTTLTPGATDTDNVLKGPFNNSRFPPGTPITITAGGTPGESTYVSAATPYVASTGVITVSPAITTGATNAVIGYGLDLDNFVHVKEAINRVLSNRAGRWQMIPLTFVPDGDLRGATVGDCWTAAANGTAAYATAQAFPAGSAADVAGATSLSRVLQLTSTGATSVAGNGIRYPHTNQQRTWYFKTPIRLVSGTGTATFSIYDNTNSADIPAIVSRGTDTLTMVTSTFGGFMVCEGIIQQPATCDELAPKLTLSATTMVAQMGPVILFPLEAVNFPLSNKVESDEFIGNFHYAQTLANSGGLESVIFGGPITTGGATHHLDNYGDHFTVSFNFRPGRPVYYDEWVAENELSAMTDTTTLPLDYVAGWAAYELLEYLDDRAPSNATGPGKWAQKRAKALAQAKGLNYAGRHITVMGRV